MPAAAAAAAAAARAVVRTAAIAAACNRHRIINAVGDDALQDKGIAKEEVNRGERMMQEHGRRDTVCISCSGLHSELATTRPPRSLK